jgi:predicted transcriptional regulator
MPNPKKDRKALAVRKARFEAALKLAQMHAKDFAKDQGVTPAQLHYVLKGDRDSARLETAIIEFTDKHLGAVAA